MARPGEDCALQGDAVLGADRGVGVGQFARPALHLGELHGVSPHHSWPWGGMYDGGIGARSRFGSSVARMCSAASSYVGGLFAGVGSGNARAAGPGARHHRVWAPRRGRAQREPGVLGRGLCRGPVHPQPTAPQTHETTVTSWWRDEAPAGARRPSRRPGRADPQGAAGNRSTCRRHGQARSVMSAETWNIAPAHPHRHRSPGQLPETVAAAAGARIRSAPWSFTAQTRRSRAVVAAG